MIFSWYILLPSFEWYAIDLLLKEKFGKITSCKLVGGIVGHRNATDFCSFVMHLSLFIIILPLIIDGDKLFNIADRLQGNQ